MEKIEPKVHASALSAGIGGYTVGKALAVLIMHYLVGATPPEVKFAIEFLVEAAATVAGGYLGGYLKQS